MTIINYHCCLCGNIETTTTMAKSVRIHRPRVIRLCPRCDVRGPHTIQIIEPQKKELQDHK